jgi:hypothetical protein
MNSNNFKGVYWYKDGGDLNKLYGDAYLPSWININMIKVCFEYDESIKEFKEIFSSRRKGSNPFKMSKFFDISKPVLPKETIAFKLNGSKKSEPIYRKIDEWQKSKIPWISPQ